MGFICRPAQSRLEQLLVSRCPLLISSLKEALLPPVKTVSLQLKEVKMWNVSLRFKTGEWLLSSTVCSSKLKQNFKWVFSTLMHRQFTNKPLFFLDENVLILINIHLFHRYYRPLSFSHFKWCWKIFQWVYKP